MRMIIAAVVGIGLYVAGLDTACVATTLRVPEQYKDLAAAIREATYGDTVLVSPGRYRMQERLRSGVKLLSTQGPDSTIVWNHRWHILKLVGCDIETQISGFTFEGKGCNICLACSTGTPMITDNVIKNSWDGISLFESNAFIRGNRISGCNRGINIDSSNPEVLENEFMRNGDALSVISAAPVISRCRFEHNSRAILIMGHSYPTIGGSLSMANDILKNGFTVYNAGLRIDGTQFTDQREVAVATHNYWGSDCPDEGRLRGEVVLRPWTNAEHDTLFEVCPDTLEVPEGESR
jgi:parallel beta-helix repeat protein